MLKANIAVLVSGGGTNLQKLLEAEAAGDLPHGRIALVVSDRAGAYALKRAAAFQTPTATVEYGDYALPQLFEAAVQRLLEAHRIDMIVLAGFLRILSAGFVRAWPERIINVHPSLIPSFCGAGFYGLKVHQAALDYGVKVSGATVHLVNEIPDGGRILLQKAVEVQDGDTPQSLQQRIMEQAEWQLLPRAAELLAAQITNNGGLDHD
ncbi:MAG: phosphoribosylglycinamide formyltransferase [Bacillota bacterium]|nr:phosphoribosylglycinamide formyltransferase [Bacillota bacterium]